MCGVADGRRRNCRTVGHRARHEESEDRPSLENCHGSSLVQIVTSPLNTPLEGQSVTGLKFGGQCGDRIIELIVITDLKRLYLKEPIVELNPLHLLGNSLLARPLFDEDRLTDPHESPTTSAFHNVAVAVPRPEGNHFSNAYVEVDDDIANRFSSVLRCELTSPLLVERVIRGTSARRDDPDTKCRILASRQSLPDAVGASHARISGEAFRASPHRLGGNGEWATPNVVLRQRFEQRRESTECRELPATDERAHEADPSKVISRCDVKSHNECGRLGNVSVSERPLCVIGFCVGCWSRTMEA
jgi:hypothetical protein